MVHNKIEHRKKKFFTCPSNERESLWMMSASSLPSILECGFGIKDTNVSKVPHIHELEKREEEEEKKIEKREERKKKGERIEHEKYGIK